MTHRLVIGIDPGQSGAIALMADGGFSDFLDMPVMPRRVSGYEVDAASLAAQLRVATVRHAGASFLAVVESVNAMPSVPGHDDVRQSMGASSAFRFGESFGVLKGVLGALRLPLMLVAPATWKARLGLRGIEKDFARTLAIRTFPSAAPHLQRKKDVGRADALLIAHWAELTEAVGPAGDRTIERGEICASVADATPGKRVRVKLCSGRVLEGKFVESGSTYIVLLEKHGNVELESVVEKCRIKQFIANPGSVGAPA